MRLLVFPLLRAPCAPSSLRIALYSNAFDKTPRPADVSWATLVELLTEYRQFAGCTSTPCADRGCEVKKARECWSPVDIHTRCLDVNVRSVNALVVDVDHVRDLGVLIQYLATLERAGLAFVVYSTHSDKPGDHCVRLVVPLSRPVPKAQWRRFWAAAIHALAVPNDPTCVNESRVYFLPDVAKGTTPFTRVHNGGPLNVDAVLTLTPPAAKTVDRIPTVAPPAPADLPALAQRLLRGTRNPANVPLMTRALAGQPLSAPGTGPYGGQDKEVLILMSTAAGALFDVSEDEIIRLFRPCFERTDWAEGVEHLEAEARKKLERAFAFMEAEEQARAERERQAEERFFSEVKPVPATSATPAPAPGPSSSTGTAEPGWTPTDAQPDVATQKTDVGNAETFRNEHRDVVRYVRALKQWYLWDGKRWKADETGAIMRLAISTARGMLRAALEDYDGDRRTKGINHASKTESLQRLSAMLQIASTLDPIAVEYAALDSDPMLLTVNNGTLDLRTGDLRPHSPEDMITKLAPVDYDPLAAAPRWTAFLERMQPAADMREFLARWMGYSLTGDVGEQKLVFFYGLGANGKSVFCQTTKELFGDYAKNGAPELLLLKEAAGGNHSAEIMGLAGARAVFCSEIEADRRFSEVTIKQLTGGESLTARGLYRDFVEFDPTYKITVSANYQPQVRGQDHAIWRRMVVVPWEQTVPEGERIPLTTLVAGLLEEGPGILAWAVQGCLRWQKHGLGIPATVRSAVDAYKDSQDVLGPFLEELCIQKPGVRVSTKDLYTAYAMWCEQGGERPWSKKAFTSSLVARGLRAFKSGSVRGVEGIRMKTGAERTEEAANQVPPKEPVAN